MGEMRRGGRGLAEMMSALIRDESGGAIIEYCLLVTLIGLSQITVLGNVGTSLSAALSRVADDLRFAAGL